MRPAKSLLDIRGPFVRQSDAGLVVPEGVTPLREHIPIYG
jgi:hypothetical protein